MISMNDMKKHNSGLINHVNIITILWGHHKFNSKDVEELYKQISSKLSINFTMYCLTDRGENGIKSKYPIKWVDLSKTYISKNNLSKYWNKIEITKKNWNGTTGVSMYFDLDTIIQKDFKLLLPLAKLNKPNLHLLPGTWRNRDRILKYIKKDGSTASNSSIMLWDSDNSETWDIFLNKINTDKEMCLKDYPGDDMFFSNEIPHNNFFEHVACGTFPGFTGMTIPKNGYFVKNKRGQHFQVSPDSFFLVLSGGKPFKGNFKLSRYYTDTDKIIDHSNDKEPNIVVKESWGRWDGSNSHSGTK